MLRESESTSLAPSAKIDGSSLPARKKTSKCLFGEFAARVWEKPDAVIADIAGISDRAARDYLNGKVDPPWIVMLEFNRAILKRR